MAPGRLLSFVSIPLTSRAISWSEVWETAGILTAHLSHNSEIAKGGHVRMGPGMHSNIVPSIKGGLECRGILDNIYTDHEMRRNHILLLQELYKLKGGLNEEERHY